MHCRLVLLACQCKLRPSDVCVYVLFPVVSVRAALPKQLNTTTMPQHSPIIGVDSGLNQALSAHYVGTFKIPLKAVTSSASTHPVSQSGVDMIGASMDKAGGFLELHAPLVTIASDLIPEGGLDAETAAKKSFNIMDGAHRLYVLKARHDEAVCFPFRVYREFLPARQRIISDGEKKEV